MATARKINVIVPQFYELTDSELARFRSDLDRELWRRSAATRTDVDDAGTIIRGQEIGKRVITIAATGQHSVTFVGSPGCGKTMLRALAHRLNVDATFEFHPCPCGYRNDPRRDCKCTIPKIIAHMKKIPLADMYIEVPPVPARELQSQLPGTSEKEMLRYVDAAAKNKMPSPNALDEFSERLLRSCISELGISADQVAIIKRVAATIACIDGSEVIKAPHISEAVNYRLLVR